MHPVLGIAGSRHDAAVALRVDGVLTAAASEDSFLRVLGIGYVQTGGFPIHATAACLERAGLGMADLSELAVVKDAGVGAVRTLASLPLFGNGAGVGGAWRSRLMSLPMKWVDPLHADATQAAASASSADAVLVFGTDPPHLTAFTRRNGGLQSLDRFGRGLEPLVSATSALAAAVGCADTDPYGSLERVAAGGEPEFLDACREAIGWRASLTLCVDRDRMTALISEASAGSPGDFADPDTPNVRTQDRRRALADSFMTRIAEVVRDATEDLCRSTASSAVVLSGEIFEHAGLNTRVKRLLGDAVSFAAIPGARGRAIGASLCGSAPLATELRGLALGPLFAEDEIKATLENCRLDYVYEPDWRRLLVRVSKMLSRGMVIGWFQGPTGFGPRSLGTRSFLCDPSSPYARENLNRYLKGRPMSEPLPLSMTAAAADDCLVSSVRSPYMLLQALVADPARARVRAALDPRHHVQIHTVSTDQAPELCELLDVHFQRTRVPGLINLNLSGPGEPTACTPRDAVRTVYSSATDALVIGRFLLMKDYWLLRSSLD